MFACASCGENLKEEFHYCPTCGVMQNVREATNKNSQLLVDNLASSKAPTPPTVIPPDGAYGAGVRGAVFMVVVRQALAGAPWREICAGPMQVNNIDPESVQAEVDRFRRGGDGLHSSGVPKKPRKPAGDTSASL